MITPESFKSGVALGIDNSDLQNKEQLIYQIMLLSDHVLFREFYSKNTIIRILQKLKIMKMSRITPLEYINLLKSGKII